MDKPQLLVIDYPGRRGSKHVSDMRLEDHGFEVRYAMNHELPRELYADSYARTLIRNSGVDPSQLVGVVGYCMAGHLAEEAVSQLAAITGSAPALILLDCSPLPAETVEKECRSAFAAFGGERMVAALDTASGAELFSTDTLRNDPLHTLAEVRRILRRFAMAMLADDDEVSIEEVEDSAELLINHYVDWITHLIAAHNTTPPPGNGDIVHILSRDQTIRGDWPDATRTKTIVIDSGENDLLGDAATRDALLSWIPRTSRTPSSAADPTGRIR